MLTCFVLVRDFIAIFYQAEYKINTLTLFFLVKILQMYFLILLIFNYNLF